MKKRKYTTYNIQHSTLFLCLLLLASNSFSQDPQYSQTYSNPLYLSPAFAGYNESPVIRINDRQQWSLENNNFTNGLYQTYCVSYDQYMDLTEHIYFNFGALIDQDEQGGIFKTTSINLILASPQIKVSDNLYVQSGLEGTLFIKQLNWNSLTFDDEIDSILGKVKGTQEKSPDNLSRSFFDASWGINFYYSDRVICGFTMNHIFQPNEGFYNETDILSRKYTFHLLTIFPVSSGESKGQTDGALKIIPSFIFQNQLNVNQFRIGLETLIPVKAYLKGEFKLFGGIDYRYLNEPANSDAIICFMGFEYKHFIFGYSHDITISTLNPNGGANEISLTYKFKLERHDNKDFLNCPKFYSEAAIKDMLDFK